LTTTSGTAAATTRVFLVGYYGVHNLGDEAIRAAIVEAAPGYGACVVRVASRDRADPDPSAVPVRGPGLVRYLGAIIRSDRVVLGGGGILKDEGLGLPLELFTTAVVARLLRRPVALLAVGVGPFYSRSGRWLAMATARLATARTVRDDDSARALAALGVGRVIVGADPTFAAWTAPSDPAPDPSPSDADRQRRVVVSIRPWFLRRPDHAGRQAALRDAIAAALAPLVEDGWVVDPVSLYLPRDQIESVALVADPRLAGTTASDSDVSDWDGLRRRVATADLVIAMRYHAVAAAAQAGRPTIALAYEPKVRSLAADLGLPIVDVHDPDLAGQLRSAVATAVEDPSSARPDHASVARLQGRAAAAMAAAFGPAREAGRTE
jgi:polysaccharide pyruvyl transferase WcaK-like protein